MRIAPYFVPLLLTFAGCGDDGSDPTTTSGDPSGSPTGSPTGSPSSPTGEESDATSDTPTTSTSSDPTTSAGTTTAPEEGAPVFLSLQTNVGKLTAGQEVIITAVLTDPDGLDDIAGGTLSSPDGKIGYGPFVAAGQPGTYSITLSWAAIHQAESIQFEAMELPRGFKAEFYDQAAHKVAQNVEVSLFCAEGSACDGACIDISSDAVHCGSCMKACDGGCETGACTPAWGECIGMKDGFETCDSYCSSAGEVCVANGCGSNDTVYVYDSTADCKDELGGGSLAEACDVAQPWTIGRAGVRCCCSDTQ